MLKRSVSKRSGFQRNDGVWFIYSNVRRPYPVGHLSLSLRCLLACSTKHDEPPNPPRSKLRQRLLHSTIDSSNRIHFKHLTLLKVRNFTQKLVRNPSLFHPVSSFNSPRPPAERLPANSEGGDVQTRVFVGHSIYKGKAALTVEPRGPEFAPLESSAFKVAKDGFVLLQFAPASGLRQYDWSRKQVFSLSVVEIGTLMSLGPKDSCEFFHDPFKGRSDEGKVRKVLKVEPLADGTGHFFNLSVQNKMINMDESIYIPVTKAEFAILNSLFNFIIPHLIGWHVYATSIKPGDAGRGNNVSPGSSADYEWNR